MSIECTAVEGGRGHAALRAVCGVRSGTLTLSASRLPPADKQSKDKAPVLGLQVDWARLEMDKLHREGTTWERVLATKRSEAGEDW